jgi:hypothetical protein
MSINHKIRCKGDQYNKYYSTESIMSYITQKVFSLLVVKSSDIYIHCYHFGFLAKLLLP